MSTNVSILGLGIMGTATARSAARGGLNTTVWNRSPVPASHFPSDNVRIAESAVDAVHAADVVITMVPDADAVLNICKSGEPWRP